MQHFPQTKMAGARAPRSQLPTHPASARDAGTLFTKL